MVEVRVAELLAIWVLGEDPHHLCFFSVISSIIDDPIFSLNVLLISISLIFSLVWMKKQGSFFIVVSRINSHTGRWLWTRRPLTECTGTRVWYKHQHHYTIQYQYRLLYKTRQRYQSPPNLLCKCTIPEICSSRFFSPAFLPALLYQNVILDWEGNWINWITFVAVFWSFSLSSLSLSISIIFQATGKIRRLLPFATILHSGQGGIPSLRIQLSQLPQLSQSVTLNFFCLAFAI